MTIMFMQLGFTVDIDRCISCSACTLACANEQTETNMANRRLKEFKTDLADLPLIQFSVGCNHCKNPACLAVCPQRCFKKRRDGIVFHDPTNCIRCESCMGACPFDAISINKHTGKTEKCNFCSSRLEEGKDPACVSACMTNALQYTNINALPASSMDGKDKIKMMQYTEPSLCLTMPTHRVVQVRRACRGKAVLI